MAGPGDSPVQVEGVVDRVVYENAETGFFVGRLRGEGGDDLITFVGDLMAVSPGETIRLWGRWVEDKRWGRQLRVQRYEILLPATAGAIEKYLGSGLIAGIGPVYAKRLVAAFGVETLRVIEEEPARLRKVPGIGPRRVTQIRQAWQTHRAVHAIMLFLQGHGVSAGQAHKIYRRYGDKAVAVLRENPYRLAGEIAGIGFRGADRIAANLGIARDAPQRLEAGLLFALDQATAEGHVFLPEPELGEAAAELLGVPAEGLGGALVSLVARQAVFREGEAVFLPTLHAAEAGCGHYLKRLVRTPKGRLEIDAERAIVWVERQHGIELSEEQRQAIRCAAAAKVMVVTGGPGTGKTTLIRSLVSIFEKKGRAVALAAPTGRAAKRMEEATERPAKTLHRLLEFSPKEGAFIRDENNPLAADVVIVDESSMVDVLLMHSLLRAVPAHARLFLVGDVDQLPSVGPGAVLLDLIASNLVPVVWLKTVFRQAAQSGIVANAHRINQGQFPEFNKHDFFFIARKDPAKAVETIVELVTRRIPRSFHLDPRAGIQVLAPMHRGDAGVSRLNEALQQALNAGGDPVPGRAFRLGDKVMQMRNNYELDVYNGDVGIVTVADAEAREVQVQFDDRAVLYSFDDLDELALAYATTVHKAQGSEYPAVVVALLPQHFLLLQRNVLYTAITRGKQLVILVGDSRAVAMAVRGTQSVQRYTRLGERLRAQV